MPAILGAGDSVGASDHEQFDQFMVSRWAKLVRLAYGLTGDRWAAEDLAQSALASAYAAWWRVRGAEDPDAYVRKILINACKSKSRRRQGWAEVPAGQDAAGASSDPAAAVGERSALMAALAELPPRQRAVIVLRYWEDMTDAQVAAVLGCAESTVRSQAARALVKLRASAELADGEPQGREGAR